MIKKYLKALIIASIVILIPMAVGLFLWDKLPEKLPIHWDSSWNVDGWSKKSFAVFVLPLILLAVEWLCVLGTFADPKRSNHSEKVLKIAFWIIPAISLLSSSVMYFVALGGDNIGEMLVPVFMGLLFVIIGNYLPKCRQNYTIGIKIPWTLDSEENWNRTHRLAGKLWTAFGFAIIILSLIGYFQFILYTAILMCLLPIIYSYILYRKGV